MQRIYLDELKPMAPPPRGTNGWIVRSKRTVLYATCDGLLQEDKGGLYRVNIVDAPAQQATVVVTGGDLHGASDTSTMEKGEQVWRLPPQHVQLVLDAHVFAPRAMGPVRLVFSLCNDRPHDTFIEVDEGVTQSTINSDVDTLLSGLKSCAGYIPCSPQH